MAWLSGWTYRKSITLSRASGAVSNYQMKLLVGESAGATGEDVDCGGHCLSTFDDLRFTTADGLTLLDYWIESISGTTPNQLATAWIEFDSIGTNATTFYMYYGKASAAAVSSGADTFIFYDDFERGSDTDAVGGGWTSTGATISTDHAYVGTRAAKLAGSATDWLNNLYASITSGEIAVQMRFWKESAAHFAIWHGDNASTAAAAIDFRDTEDIYVSNSGSSDVVDTTKNCQSDAWDFMEIRNFNWPSKTYDVYYTDGQLAASGVMMTGTGSAGKVTIYDRQSGVGNDTYIDNFIVRQFLATEPAWGSWSSEVSATAVSVPTASLSLTVHQGIQTFPICAPAFSLSMYGYAPTYITGTQAPCSGLILTPHAPTPEMTLYPALAELTLTPKSPSYVWSIPARNRPAAQIIYTCTLTGDGESPVLSDLTLPMSSFQGRMRDGDPSYISAVIPNCMDYSDAILARQNGDIVIKKGFRFIDGTTQLEEIARVDFESVRIDKGSHSASATISGHKTISSTTVKEITVEGVSYYSLQADGKRRVRALLDLFLRIGDTCIYGSGVGDYMTVGYISYTVSVNQTSMEVTEA